ncbi:hypothetical protein BGW38_003806 [Lunasporangiospora selenospora]|uniref:protein disulfide-isomerase n=1 Tax=Lunasporangiospora selenospora TaxID=979761 RepID=A0A9P6KCK8_9FUNG|nr:hypothetical protein BGW38_003806 [Lunasporangiospora selenospora]
MIGNKISLAFALLAFVSKALADGALELTPESFDTTLGTLPALVEFYAPWCGHCKTLEPIYDELSEAFTAKKDKLVVAKVNADEHRALGEKFGIKGYPTIKWFPNGFDSTPEDYKGRRDLESLRDFVTGKSGFRAAGVVVPAVAELTGATFDDRVLNSKKSALVEFYAPWCGHCKALAPTYEKVGQDFQHEKNILIAKVDATVETALASQYKVSGYPTIKFFDKDGSVQEYDGGRSEESFLEFINKKIGTHRAPGGRFNKKAGRISRLDTIAEKFAQATTVEEKEALSKEALEVAAGLETESDQANAKHYARIFEKATQNPEFVAKESARLSKIIEAGKASNSKLDELSIKHNIIAAFEIEAVTRDEL